MNDNNEIRVKLLNVSKKVKENELKELKSICCKIEDGILEKISCPLDLFKKICNRFEKEEDALQYIAKLLMEIGRKALSNELRGIEINDQNLQEQYAEMRCKGDNAEKISQPEDHNPQEEYAEVRCRGDNAERISQPEDQKPQKQNVERSCFLLVEEKVAANWRQLGRHLGHDGDTLGEIESDYNSSKDKCAGVLEKWKKRDGVDMDILKKALRDMGRNDVIDEIKELEDHNPQEDYTEMRLKGNNAEKISQPEDQKPQKQNVERSCFLLVEEKVAANWRQLGRHLGHDGDTLGEIESDYNSSKDKCAGVLGKWKKRDGVDMDILKKALRDMGRNDVIDEIKELEGNNRYSEE